jgi:CheY-like chemotaxis protein
MTETNTQGKKILVLDDEPNVVTYLVTLLQDHGYQTVSAANGNEGLAKARSEHPDLICLDITMPEKSGIAFYRELRADPDLTAIPVVVVTAVTGFGGDPEPFRHFLSTRRQVTAPEAFFAKPIDREQFLSKVDELLA